MFNISCYSFQTNEYTCVMIISGDFGGYMGLLLGCSVMTLLEVLDLLLYNSLVQCRKRNKVHAHAYDHNGEHGSDMSRESSASKQAWSAP